MNFMEKLAQQSDITISENGALEYSTTRNPLLDFNFKISSYRNDPAQGIIDWQKVLIDHSIDIKTKIKYLFYLRDVRQGVGERRLFRQCLIVTVTDYPEYVIPTLELIPQYGRFDDLIYLLDHTDGSNIANIITEILQKQWLEDIKNCQEGKSISLLAKWSPSCNSHSPETKRLGKLVCSKLGLKEKTYRKALSMLRAYINIVEKNLSAKTYDKIIYEQVPSKAALLYKDTFLDKDTERYTEYLEALKEGKAKVNASVTMPYEIVHKYAEQLGVEFGNSWYQRHRNTELTVDPLFEEAWKNIPVEDIASCLVVCDSSGSMCTKVSGAGKVECIDISNALAIFFAEHSKGEFKDRFITFSSRPQFVDLSKCNSLAEKMFLAAQYDDCSNTNLKAVFDLILQTAIKNNMKSEDLPKSILICSDMNFDGYSGNDKYGKGWGLGETFMESIRKDYEDAGYSMPTLIWWNITNRATVFPEVQNNIKLVSGFSQNNYKAIMSGELDPWKTLLSLINDDRYNLIEEVLVNING